MTSSFVPVRAGERLSVQVADQLAAQIRESQWPPGTRLPTEAQLVQQFQVSRTVVREALSRLKSLGLLSSRQGSGVFVSAEANFAPLNFGSHHAQSKVAVLQMVELRRALESEVAGLAAQRRDAANLRAMRAALQRIEDQVALGNDGVDEDVLFHRSVAEAAHNPFMMHTLDFLAQFLRGSTLVTRANEARRHDFMDQVRAEHQVVFDAIEAADPVAARAAAASHMDNAAGRIEQADPSFWRAQGAELAHPLLSGVARAGALKAT